MRNKLITLLLILIFLTSCGAQVKSNDEQITQPLLDTPVSADSIESIDKAIEEEGFTLSILEPNSQKMQKQRLDHIRIKYSSTQDVNISTHTLYSITNEENQSIIVTIDNILLDNIEKSSSFIIYHTLPLIPYGFTNLNTILTDTNATIMSTLDEIEKAFKQKTLNNPSSQRVTYEIIDDSNNTMTDGNTTITDNNTTTQKTLINPPIEQVTYHLLDDINISYQTVLKNQDEIFECNGEAKIIDAQNGFTILDNLLEGQLKCTFGINSILMFDFNITKEDIIPPIITLNGESNITLTINENYTELNATAIDNVDGNLSVLIFGDVNTSKVGIYLITYTAEDKSGNVANKNREVNVKPSEGTNSSLFSEEVDTEEEEE